MQLSHIRSISTIHLFVPDTYLVAKLSLNLLFVGQLCEHGLSLYFFNNGCIMQDTQTGKIVGKGRKVKPLFELTSFHILMTNIVASI